LSLSMRVHKRAVVEPEQMGNQSHDWRSCVGKDERPLERVESLIVVNLSVISNSIKGYIQFCREWWRFGDEFSGKG